MAKENDSSPWKGGGMSRHICDGCGEYADQCACKSEQIDPLMSDAGSLSVTRNHPISITFPTLQDAVAGLYHMKGVDLVIENKAECPDHADELEYRMLETGEVIQEGDEILMGGRWEKSQIKGKVLHARFRRRITKPEPSDTPDGWNHVGPEHPETQRVLSGKLEPRPAPDEADDLATLERVERELAEAREELDLARDHYASIREEVSNLGVELIEAREQRDRLAEALEYTIHIMEEDGYGPPWTTRGREALAAVKGGQP